MSFNVKGLRKVKVLIVEDDEDDLYRVKQLLNCSGKVQFEIRHAYSIASLKAQVTDYQPDVVLLDLNILDSEGMETLVVVMDILPDTPVIVLTGQDESDFGLQTINCGAQDFLPKAEFTHFNLQRSIRFALERHQLVQALSDKALKDPLTLLPNRIMFEETLNRWIKEAQQHDHSLALMILDLNGFKAVNDTFGHLCGDKILEQIGSRLRLQSRHNDLIARIGGDEFAAIYRNIPCNQDLETIAQQKIEIIEEDCLFVHNGKVTTFHVGVSIGISRLSLEANTPEKLLDQADKVMYQAKRNSNGESTFAIFE